VASLCAGAIFALAGEFQRERLQGAIVGPVFEVPRSTEELIGAGEDACYPGGLFCFKSFSGTNTQVHLVRCSPGRIEPLFVKPVPGPVKAPICLANGVVAVSADGVVRRFDLSGNSVFSAKPEGFEGVARDSGRVDFDRIFITQVTTNSRNRFLYHLLVVDVAGAQPVVRAKMEIIHPFRVVVAGWDFVIIGGTNTQRLRIPEGLNPKRVRRAQTARTPAPSRSRMVCTWPGDNP
jgi:hypothetical protein